jgi:uncharacterized repeat protein (TIGR02543 family)
LKAINANGESPASAAVVVTPGMFQEFNPKNYNSTTGVWTTTGQYPAAVSAYPSAVIPGYSAFEPRVILGGNAEFVSGAITTPSSYFLSAWFKTTSSGKLIGLENQPNGSNTNGSSAADKMLYIDTNGKLKFGIFTSITNVLYSTRAVNDGTWHQAVGSYNASTKEMNLYLDGTRIAHMFLASAASSFAGYWRIGGYANGWDGSLSPNGYFTGSMGVVSINNAPAEDAGVQLTYNTYAPYYVPHNVTYSVNGGTSATPTQAATWHDQTFTTAATPVRDGYTFTGWSDGTSTYAAGTTYTMGVADVTLTAQWTPSTYTVTYNYNGATGGASTVSGSFTTLGTAITLPTPTRTGYTFAGWYSNSGLTTSIGAAGASYSPTGATLALNAYAKWTADSHHITYALGGGTGTLPTQGDVVTAASFNLAGSSGLSRAGYTFAGWNDGSSTYAAGAVYTMSTADVTLTARWTAANHHVTYALGGGTGTLPTQADVATDSSFAVAASTGLSKTGYTFAGWSDGANTKQPGDTYVMGVSDVTLTALWSAVSRSVTYVGGGSGVTGTLPTQSAVGTDGVFTVAAGSGFARPGYTFAGWSDGSRSYDAGDSYTVALTNVVLTALWSANSYTVTYHYNGATGGAATVSDSFTTGGAAITLPTPSKTGYTFAGWYSDAGFTTSIGAAGVNYSPNGSDLSIVAYAKWSANTSTITYDANGASGSASRSSDSFVSGSAGISLPTVGSLVRAGYDFAGWSTTAGGSALTGSSASAFTTLVDVRLYAVWQAKTIQVTYDKGLASSVTVSSFPSNTSGTYGSPFTLASGVTGRVTISGDSYDFLGWNDGTGTFSPGDSYTLPSSNVTLVAQWVRVFEVHYALNGGTAASMESDVDSECVHPGNLCIDQQVITLNTTPTRAGYTFAGWEDQQGVSFAAGASKTITATSYLFYAQWAAINYTVTYNSAGGSTAPTHGDVHIGDSLIVGADPTRTGYTFNGWRAGSTNYFAGATYVVGAANVSFVAQWVADVYTVSFNWNGASGSSTAAVNYTVGTTGITLPTVTDQVLDGYTFNGWIVSGGSTLLSSPYVPTGDVTLIARWGTGSYTVAVNGNGATFDNAGSQVSSHNFTVPNGSSLTLPTISRPNFHFVGWFTAASGGTQVVLTSGGFQPIASQSVYARWVQNSLWNVGAHAYLGSVQSVTGTTSHVGVSHTATGNAVDVTVPDGALPNGTTVDIYAVSDSTSESAVIDPLVPQNQVLANIVVAWLALDGTVPTTATGKPLSVVITNSAIKAGAKVAMIVNGVVTIVATATVDGSVTVSITDDPDLVVIATEPDAPNGVSAVRGNTSATVSWSAPASNGGAVISSYLVTSSGGQTCTTTGALTCVVTGLTNGSSYTFRVQALNSVGASLSSSASSPVVPIGPQTLAFTAPLTSAFVGSTYSISVSATSGLAVTVSVDVASALVCSVNSGVVTMLSAGTCTLIASQAGNIAYLAASSIHEDVLVTVAPAPAPAPAPTPTPTPAPKPSPIAWTTPVVSAVSEQGQASASVANASAVLKSDLSKFETNYVGTMGLGKLTVALGGGTALTASISKTRLVLERSAKALVTGSGYAPNGKVLVWLFPEAKVIASASTDATGDFTASYNFTANEKLGNHVLIVQALNSTGLLEEQQVPVLLVQPTKYNTNVDFPVVFDSASVNTSKGLTGLLGTVSNMALARITTITFYHVRAQKSNAVVLAKAQMNMLREKFTALGMKVVLRSQAKQIKLYQMIKKNMYINISGFLTR